VPQPAASFRRELPDYVTVAVDGTIPNVDPDITERPSARVVLTMPDATADALAHVIAQAWQVADLLGAERLGDGDRALAEALYEAAAASGYRCPDGGLHLPPRG
jgi:hypothetical protein